MSFFKLELTIAFLVQCLSTDPVIDLIPNFFGAIIAVNHRTDFFAGTEHPATSIDFSSRNVLQVIRKRKYTKVFRSLNIN